MASEEMSFENVNNNDNRWTTDAWLYNISYEPSAQVN